MDNHTQKRASRKDSSKVPQNVTIVIQKLILPPGSTPESFLTILMQLSTGIQVKFECLEIAE